MLRAWSHPRAVPQINLASSGRVGPVSFSMRPTVGAYISVFFLCVCVCLATALCFELSISHLDLYRLSDRVARATIPQLVWSNNYSISYASPSSIL